MNIIKTLTVTASTLLLIAGQTAFADSIGEPAPTPATEAFEGPTMKLVFAPDSDSTMAAVSYTAESLENEEGVRAVYELLKRASKSVCAGKHFRSGRNTILSSSQARCYRQQISSAVNKIGNENLTRFHTG